MKFVSIIRIITVLLISSLAGQIALAKDKAYKFEFKGYVSEKIIDQDDLALLKAAEYSIKKGYDYFVLNRTRRYDRATVPARTGRIGRRQSTRPRLRTELEIHCYDTEQSVENSYNANLVVEKINQKYAD